MREFLKGLDLDGELIDTIMAEHGKIVTKDKEELQTLKSQMKELKENSKNADELQKQIDELIKANEEREASKKAEEEDNILINNINSVLGDKKFVNDFTKNAIINEVKTALKDKANLGKSAKDLLEEITNGKDGIFANPNQVVDMPSIDENVENVVSKDDFDKMGYKERVALKESNPELFNKYNNM